LQRRFGGFGLRKFLLFFYPADYFNFAWGFARAKASPAQLLNHGQAHRQEPPPFLLVKK
jgi:hypothetical protein